MPLRRLKKRAQFRRAAEGHRAGGEGMSLQAAKVDAGEPGIGFTVTKRAGNAVERNRIKRRLRAAVEACADGFQTRHDYVLIGRREVLGARFQDLAAGLQKLIIRVNSKSHSPRRT